MSVGSVRDLLSLKQWRAHVAFIESCCVQIWTPITRPACGEFRWKRDHSQAESARSEFRHGNSTRVDSKVRGMSGVARFSRLLTWCPRPWGSVPSLTRICDLVDPES